jgi:hypothetical protein
MPAATTEAERISFLVPKLHLGTHLSGKLYFPRPDAGLGEDDVEEGG